MKETDWSLEMIKELTDQSWHCTNCKVDFNVFGLERLQHTHQCHPITQDVITTPEKDLSVSCPNALGYDCSLCGKNLNLTKVEILKHKIQCAKSSQKTK